VIDDEQIDPAQRADDVRDSAGSTRRLSQIPGDRDRASAGPAERGDGLRGFIFAAAVPHRHRRARPSE